MNNKIKILDIIYIILMFGIIILAFFPAGLMITISDEFEIESNIQTGILIGVAIINILLSMALFVISIVELCMKRYINNISRIFAFILLILSYMLSVILVNQYTNLMSDYKIQSYSNTLKDDDILKSTITLEGLKNLKNENKDAIIYFERSDCPECIAISPDLINYLNNFGVKYYQYNTLDDRENNLKELEDVLSEYSVVSVPSIVELSKGEVAEVYDEQNIQLLLYPE